MHDPFLEVVPSLTFLLPGASEQPAATFPHPENQIKEYLYISRQGSVPATNGRLLLLEISGETIISMYQFNRGAIHLLRGEIINTTNIQSLSLLPNIVGFCISLCISLSLDSNKNTSLAGNDPSEMSVSKRLINQFLRAETAF